MGKGNLRIADAWRLLELRGEGSFVPSLRKARTTYPRAVGCEGAIFMEDHFKDEDMPELDLTSNSDESNGSMSAGLETEELSGADERDCESFFGVDPDSVVAVLENNVAAHVGAGNNADRVPRVAISRSCGSPRCCIHQSWGTHDCWPTRREWVRCGIFWRQVHDLKAKDIERAVLRGS